MKVNDIVLGKVKKIYKTHMIIELPENFNGLVHISQISDYFVSNISSMFKVDEKYYFFVEGINKKENQVKLNWKILKPRYEKDPFEHIIEETKEGFNNLRQFTKESIEND